MAVAVTLPSLSAGMEDGVIARWLVKPGDRVTKGQVLAEVETDKATMEIEAEADGIIGSLDVEEGKRADVGQVIVTILAEGESGTSSPTPVAPEPSAPQAATPVAASAPATGDRGASQGHDGERKHGASPLARRLAAAAGLDLTGVVGSGPHGRIVKIDIERLRAAAAQSPQAGTSESAPSASPAAATSPTSSAVPAGIGAYEAKPLSSMRRAIARRLVEAKQTIPHFYLNADCELDALLALRAQINATRDKTAKISVNDFVIKAAALALRKVPDANVIWNGDEILQLADVDISVAVSVEGGLITPILRGADRMSIGTLSAEMKALATRAREGKLKPEEYQGGGFCVSNLGMYGVKSFSAIINPPQSCILAVGAVERRPVGRGDQIVLADVMTVTLSVDHRSVDGVLGAQLLAAFREAIEDPMSLLL